MPKLPLPERTPNSESKSSLKPKYLQQIELLLVEPVWVELLVWVKCRFRIQLTQQRTHATQRTQTNAPLTQHSHNTQWYDNKTSANDWPRRNGNDQHIAPNTINTHHGCPTGTPYTPRLHPNTPLIHHSSVCAAFLVVWEWCINDVTVGYGRR